MQLKQLHELSNLSPLLTSKPQTESTLFWVTYHASRPCAFEMICARGLSGSPETSFHTLQSLPRAQRRLKTEILKVLAYLFFLGFLPFVSSVAGRNWKPGSFRIKSTRRLFPNSFQTDTVPIFYDLQRLQGLKIAVYRISCFRSSHSAKHQRSKTTDASKPELTFRFPSIFRLNRAFCIPSVSSIPFLLYSVCWHRAEPTGSPFASPCDASSRPEHPLTSTSHYDLGTCNLQSHVALGYTYACGWHWLVHKKKRLLRRLINEANDVCSSVSKYCWRFDACASAGNAIRRICVGDVSKTHSVKGATILQSC